MHRLVQTGDNPLSTGPGTRSWSTHKEHRNVVGSNTVNMAEGMLEVIDRHKQPLGKP